MSSYVTNDNSFLDVKNAHLRVAGNVHADTIRVGAVEFNPGAPIYSETVQFSNTTTGLTTVSNVSVGGTLVLHGIEVSGGAENTLESVTTSGNTTTHPIILTNATTGLHATGNIHASKFYGDGTTLTGIALASDLVSNDARITALSTYQTSNNARIDTIADDITSNSSRITTIETSTTGDILVATGTNTLGKLGIGSSGQVLKVASGGSTLEWAAESGGGGGGNTLESVTDTGNVTSNTIQLTNATTGLVATGNVEASKFIGDGSLLTGISGTASNLHQAVENGNVTSNTIQLTNATTGLVATGNVEVGGTLVLHGIEVSSGAVSNTLESVTTSGNTSTHPIILTNATTGLVATGNVEASKFIGDGSLLTGISGTASNLHQAVENSNVTSNTIQLTNATTGLVATGNIEASKFIGDGSLLTGIALNVDHVDNASRITTLESANTVQGGLITAIETDVTDNASRITTLESANTVQGGLITDLETDLDSNANKIQFITSTADSTVITSNLDITGNIFMRGDRFIVESETKLINDAVIGIANNNVLSTTDVGIIMQRPDANVALVHHGSGSGSYPDQFTMGYTQSTLIDSDITTDEANIFTLNVLGNVTAQNNITSTTSTVSNVMTMGTTKTFVVEVGSNGKYEIDGIDRPALELHQGQTYIFDQSDSTNGNHPIAFSTAYTGSSSSYTTGVTSVGTPGNSGAKTTFVVPLNAPSSIHYYCTVHGAGMGSSTPSSIASTSELIVSGRVVASGNVEASAFIGDGTKLTGVALSVDMTDNTSRITTLETANTVQGGLITAIETDVASNAYKISFVSATVDKTIISSNVDISSNIEIRDTAANVLTVTGNTYVTADLNVGGKVSFGQIGVVATHSLQAVTILGATTSNTIQLTNATTGLVATGNVEASKFIGDGSLLTGIALNADATDNALRITTLETDVTDNASRITTLESANTVQGGLITAIETDVTDNALRITTLGTDVASNASKIAFITSTVDTTSIASNLNVTGNLNILGTTTTVDTDNLRVKDPIIELGKDNVGTGDLGLVMTRPSASSNVAIIFDESTDTLEIGYTQGNALDTDITMQTAAANPISVNVNGTISGDGSGLTALNATNIASGTLDVARIPTLNQNTTGSAATLTTPRSIGGVDFDGSVAIVLPGVDTTGTQNTSGSAATLTTARSIGGVDFDGSEAIVPTTFNGATFDTDTLVVDATNNRVGIGNVSPDNKLEISDLTSTNPTLLKLTCETAANPGESNTAIQLSGTSGGGYGGYIEGYLEQGVGSGLKLGHINSSQVKTEHMRIIANGNVGIGMTDPQRSLHVKSTSGMMIEDNATTSAIYVDNVAQGETGEVYSYILNAPRPGTTGSGATHFINGSGRTGDGGASTYTIRNDSGKLRLGGTSGDTIIEGNVGIGTDSPDTILHVEAASNPQILVEDTGTANQSTIRFKTATTDWAVGQHGGETGKFKIANHTVLGTNDHITIETSGNVGIGTVSPTDKLHVNGIVKATNLDLDGNVVRSAANITLAANSWAKIADFAGLVTGGHYLISIKWDNSALVGGGTAIWYGGATYSTYVIGSASVYNTTGDELIKYNAHYHYRTISAFEFVQDSDSSSGNYGQHSIYMKSPQSAIVANGVSVTAYRIG